ncbi:MAG: hypothetical protein ACRD2Z_03305 [Thermoanaerobaculia bacterium]
MAARNQIEIPSKAELLKLAEGVTTFKGLAERVGVHAATLRHRLDAEGILGQVRAAIKARKPEPRPGDDVSEVEVLRQRVRELEALDRAQRREDVFEERVLISLKHAVEARRARYSPRAIPKSQRKSDQHEFVLLHSDAHAGEVVSPEETNGLNSYDYETLLRRQDRLREGVLSYLDNRPYRVRKLYIANLGDGVGGAIHEELAETNELPEADVAVQYGMDNAVLYEQLADPFAETEVIAVYGNHGRLSKKPRAKRGYNNWDRVSTRVTALALRNDKRFRWHIPQAPMYPFTVARHYRALAWHGDGVRSTMPGVPWGGVQRRAAALQNQYTQAGQSIYIFLVGHFHIANLVQGSAGWVAMNGSIKGLDEYSLKAFGSGSGPQQLLLTFHPRRGLTDLSVIDLENPRGGEVVELRAAA